MTIMRKTALAGLGALALSLPSAGAHAAVAATYANGTIIVFATQAVTASNGAVTIPNGITFTTADNTAVSTAGSFLINFTLPTGVLFGVSPTAVVTSATTCAPNPSLAPSGGGAGANSATYSITVIAGGTVGTGCTIALNGFTVTGATALATATGAGKFEITEQVSASVGLTPSANQAVALKTDLAQSTSALTFVATTGASATNVAALIDVLPPGNGTKLIQGPGTDVTVFDGGRLDTTLNASQNATATAQFTFTGTTLAATATGNFTGVNGAYIAPVATATCATTFAGRPAGALSGVVSGNTITFSGVGAGFDAAAGVTESQEICLYYNGTTIIGQNPFTSPINVTGTVDTTTSKATTLNTETYNGQVTQLQYTGTFAAYPMFVRIVNGNSGAAQVFAVVQSDAGVTGSAQVESGLAGNNNDLVPASTILTNAGITSGGRASITVLSPFGVVASGLTVSPDGTLTSLP